MRSSGRLTSWCPRRWQFSSPEASCLAAPTRLEETSITQSKFIKDLRYCLVMLILFWITSLLKCQFSWTLTHPACPELTRCSCTRSGFCSEQPWGYCRYSCSQHSHPWMPWNRSSPLLPLLWHLSSERKKDGWTGCAIWLMNSNLNHPPTYLSNQTGEHKNANEKVGHLKRYLEGGYWLWKTTDVD